MVQSMTGYGKASGEFNNTIITVEVKSLNSKFFDLNLRLPSNLKARDLELRGELSKRIGRGKVDVTINCESQQPQTLKINKDLITAYYNEFSSLAESLKMPPADYMRLIAGLPDVISDVDTAPSEDEWKAVKSVLDEAVEKFDGFRLQEGKTLETELEMRMKNIGKLLKEIDKFETARLDNIRGRILRNIKEFMADVNFDQNRLEQEMIYHIEKLDITEEKVRLSSHIDYFIKTFDEAESNGKKLHFISQECGREINTIGSKANDASMQKLVINMKDELERVKEQLSNVL